MPNVYELVGALEGMGKEVAANTILRTRVFETGVIRFRKVKPPSGNRVLHREKDVLCLVLSGAGMLHAGTKVQAVKRGDLCYIPKGVEHDFMAAKRELSLFYILLRA